MSFHNSNQGAPPPYPYQQPPQGQQSNDYAPYPHFSQEQLQQQQQGDQRWGTGVMGEPSNPNAHPDNQHVASGAYTAQHPPSSGSGNLQDQVQASKAQAGSSVPGQAPQPNQPNQPNQYVQQASNPNSAGTGTGTGGKGTMDQFRTQVTEYANRGQIIANNVWGHLMTGSSVADTAWGRVTAGTMLLTKGGFEGVFKATFPTDANEKLKKTYACFLSTSTGPVAGTLYISSRKFAFCSDRPLSYTPAQGGGQQAYSYYKVIIPLDRVKDITPSVNQSKPTEKYIQVATLDNFEFWFMGFVNYDKGVKNLQEAVSSATGQTPGQNEQAAQQPYPPNQSSQQPYPPNQPTHQNSYRSNHPNQYGTS